MRIVEEELPDMPGQDAFLDVLTNMVGIIILLVVVIGIRTSRATVRAAVEQVQSAANAEDTASKDQLQDAQRATLVAESDLTGLPEPVQRYLRLVGVVGQPRVRNYRLASAVGSGAGRTAPGCHSRPSNRASPIRRRVPGESSPSPSQHGADGDRFPGAPARSYRRAGARRPRLRLRLRRRLRRRRRLRLT